MNLATLHRMLIMTALVVGGLAAWVLACGQAWAQQDIELLGPLQSSRQDVGSDFEELDLGAGRQTATSPSSPITASSPERGSCEAVLPSGAPVGAWGSLSASEACQAKLLAQSQASVAYAVHDMLWCSDPGGTKLAARQIAQARVAQHRGQVAQKQSWDLSEKFRKSGISMGWPIGELLKSKATTASTTPPALDYYDPTQEMALSWDVRESEKCKNWVTLGPELGPSLSVRAKGHVETPQGPCDAILVETNFLSGRRGLSRLSWISSKCPGFSPPDAAELALALSGPKPAAQIWQDRHFQGWKWQGPPARPAKSRSAEGF